MISMPASDQYGKGQRKDCPATTATGAGDRCLGVGTVNS